MSRPKICSRMMLGVLLFASSGCALLSSGPTEENRRQTAALRAELARSKDEIAKLRTQNRELTSRSMEDSRRLATLETSNDQLQKSVSAYQDERDQMANAFDQLKSSVRAPSNANP